MEPPRFVCLRSTTERLLKLADPLVHVLRPLRTTWTASRLLSRAIEVRTLRIPARYRQLIATTIPSDFWHRIRSPFAGCTYGAPYLADGAGPPAFSWTTFAACRPCYTGKLHRPCRYGRWMLPSPPKQRLGACTHRIAAGMSHDATSGFTARYGLRFRVGVPEPAWVRCPLCRPASDETVACLPLALATWLLTPTMLRLSLMVVHSWRRMLWDVINVTDTVCMWCQ